MDLKGCGNPLNTHYCLRSKCNDHHIYPFVNYGVEEGNEDHSNWGNDDMEVSLRLMLGIHVGSLGSFFLWGGD